MSAAIVTIQPPEPRHCWILELFDLHRLKYMLLIASSWMASSWLAIAAMALDDATIRVAFASVHQGLSTDVLLIREDLRIAYLEVLGVPTSDDEASAWAVASLIALRKRGDLNVKTTARLPGRPDPHVRPIAELAARWVIDQSSRPIDQLLIDPVARRQLARRARTLAGMAADDPDGDAFDQSIRRAVLTLRKQRRLRPELVRRVSDWVLQILQFDVASLQPETLPSEPAVYLFLNPTGYLYIGEAADVRARISDHLQGSHNEALAAELQLNDPSTQLQIHVFGSGSPGRRAAARQAYESELIRIRQPRYNLRP